MSGCKLAARGSGGCELGPRCVRVQDARQARQATRAPRSRGCGRSSRRASCGRQARGASGRTFAPARAHTLSLR
eukprot:829727-Rhodomonas_salina.2